MILECMRRLQPQNTCWAPRLARISHVDEIARTSFVLDREHCGQRKPDPPPDMKRTHPGASFLGCSQTKALQEVQVRKTWALQPQKLQYRASGERGATDMATGVAANR